MPIGTRICLVTHCLPPYYGGADIAALRYYKFLKSTGMSVLIASSMGTPSASGEYVINNYYKINTKWDLYYLIKAFAFFLAFLKSLNWFIRHRNKFDLIHCFSASTWIAIQFTIIGKFFGKKVIAETCLIGSDDPKTMLNGDHGLSGFLKLSHFRRRAFEKTDIMISKSKAIDEIYNEWSPGKKIKRIPYFVDTDLFGPVKGTKRVELKKSLNLPTDRVIIMFAGGLNPRKGVDLLVKSFKNINSEFKNLFLLLLGPDDKSDKIWNTALQSSLDQLEPGSYYATRDVRTNIHEYMSVADIFVLPSFREGFPISNLEAMVSELLLISSDIPEIKEVQVSHFKNGLLFETGSISDLTEKIKWAIENERDAKLIAENARKLAIEKYSIDRIFEQYSDVYAEFDG